MNIDLPIPELYKYQGRNPRPSDYDAYWERALAELEGTPPEARLVPAGFTCPGVDCFDLWFTGVRGAQIHAKYVRPAGLTSPAPTILYFHGYTNGSPDWYRLLPFAAAGMAVAAMDCRGQGGLSEDPGGVKGTTMRGLIIRGLDDGPDNLTMRHVFLDTAQLARVLGSFDEIDSERLGCVGASQGGALCIVAAALEPKIKRIAPIYPFLSDYRRVWEMDLAKDAYFELGDYFRRFDPLHQREEEIFTTLGYIDIQFLAPRIKAQVFMQTGLMDTITPPSTQFAVYNKIESPKEILLYPDFAHEEAPGHMDRVITFMLGL